MKLLNVLLVQCTVLFLNFLKKKSIPRSTKLSGINNKKTLTLNVKHSLPMFYLARLLSNAHGLNIAECQFPQRMKKNHRRDNCFKFQQHQFSLREV